MLHSVCLPNVSLALATKVFRGHYSYGRREPNYILNWKQNLTVMSLRCWFSRHAACKHGLVGRLAPKFQKAPKCKAGLDFLTKALRNLCMQ